MKKYNNCLFFDVQRGFMALTGSRTGNSSGDQSSEGYIKKKRIYVKDEIPANSKINKKGLVCMANDGKPDTNGSKFFITLRGVDLSYLDGKHTIVGEVVEGFEELEKIMNETFVDEKFRPLQDIRILHTFVLEDPTDDYDHMEDEYDSPDEEKPPEEVVDSRLKYGETVEDKDKGKTEKEMAKDMRREEAKSRAEVLEMVGDLPDAEIKPPENVLFVCKLNPITTDEDLELLFSRFGDIKECEIIKDQETGESLQYAFIEFMSEDQCNEAYAKMNNVIVDDRRIKVDFSQSVAKIWNKWTMQPRKRKKQTLESYKAKSRKYS